MARKPQRGRNARRRRLCDVVGVGASAGGLEAFSAVLEHLPADTGMAIVFVSHLDPKHESILTSLLARKTSMPVREAKHGMVLEPDHVYVIPRNTRMGIDKSTLTLSRRLEAPAKNLPIDHFLASLARDRGPRAIGVILSGTASDGTLGLAAIRNAGGISIAQDPGTARYDGMPRSAIRANAADFVLPPREIAAKLSQLARNLRPAAGVAAPVESKESPAGGLAEVFARLRERTGVDFSAYKEATVQRRLHRRMTLGKIRSVADYARFLRRTPAELDALYEDLLIKVTGFFRDPKTLERLKTRILPTLLKKKPPREPFRVWVPGCSTGEEAYSLAILLFEVTDRLRVDHPIQIFATDLSEKAIATARAGVYPSSIAGSVSPARRRRFFVKLGRGWKIGQRVREACVFARQDITRDPPYSKVDLVSCRNVLIYMGKPLQETILSIFHYALRPDGCLLLGKAETPDGSSGRFAPLDAKHRVYRKKPAPAGEVAGATAWLAGSGRRPAVRAAIRERTGPSLREEANQLIMERYAPAGVVINEKLEMIEILGDPHPYVRFAPGTANLSILRLVRRDLIPELSDAVGRARKTGAPVRREGWPARRGHGPGRPALEVIPMPARTDRGAGLLVLFETVAPLSAAAPGTKSPAKSKAGGSVDGREVIRLRNELRLLIDSRQSAEEELKAANEELMASMEELQSANEELQTSHEELESTNEELTTVNDQLGMRNRDLTEIGNDLANLVKSVDVPILILTGDLKLRRSTPAADKVMGLTPADVGRPVSDIRHTLRFADLEQVAAEVLRMQGARDIEVQDRLNVWYSMRLRPYRTEDGRISGLVVVLFEIDRLKRSFQEVERARNFSRTIVEAVQEPLLVLGGDRRVLMANRAFLETFHTSATAMEHRLVFELEPSGFRSAAFKRMLEESLGRRSRLKDFEIEFETGSSSPKIMAIDARQFDLHGDDGTIILITMKDITRFRLTERRLVASRDTVQKGRLRAESSLRESRQDLSASRAELRVLAGRLIRAQEDERKRVARELHDDLTQRLSALQIGSAGLARLTPAGEPARAGFVAHEEHIAEAVEEVRRLAYDLHPAILTHLGLRAALKSFCVKFSGREQIDVDFSAQKEPAGLSEETALCLYRVTQEGLRNVAKHSGAKSAGVVLKTVRGVVHLTIQDRGRGFGAVGSGEGLGLLGMKERVRLVHGTIQVRSKPGHGTRIEVRVPVRPGSA
ncbi:MAG TPA: chemotaxis protein CheB [Verrucomicrobiae bacterium]|nr:chemotaxis protein CheB [Verrucomicrobiae bacterium]